MDESVGYLLAFLVIASTFIPFLKFSDWWIRVGDFPRIQIIGVGLISMAFFIYDFSLPFPELIAIFLILLCVSYQFFMVLPFSPMYEKQIGDARNPNPEEMVKLVVCNVYMKNRDWERCLRVINAKDPDIILLVETDKWWMEKMEPLGEGRKHRVLHPLDNTYGMLLYSRFPLENPKIQFLIEENIPSIHTKVILPSGKIFRLHCLHPKPPAPQHSLKSVKRDAELLVVGKEVKQTDDPVIVCGDMNDVAWSGTTNLFQKISGLLDPRIGRGMFNTFHAKIPFFRWPLDHIFISKDFLLVGIERLEKIGSDHFPIFLNAVLQPVNGQEELEADEDEKEEMEEKIDEVGGRVEKPEI